MSTVAEVIDAVKHFTEEEKDEFLARLQEIAFEEDWDFVLDRVPARPPLPGDELKD